MPNPNLPINAQYNTYVGARYVPKFANPPQWDNTIQYEPLTIVLYKGISYTSTTFVPVGINITNTNYWLETGNYNAQVEQYRQEVLQLKQNKVLMSKYYLCIGDSYASPTGSTFFGYTMANLGLTGNSFDIIGDPGMGFTKTGRSGYNCLGNLQAWIAANPDKLERVTDVIICIGSNDANQVLDITAFRSAVDNVLKFNKNHFPNAVTHMGMNGFTNSDTGFISQASFIHYTNLMLVANAMQQQTLGAGQIWIPQMSNVLSGYGQLSTDKVHPSNYGQLSLARLLTQHLLGFGYSYNLRSNIPQDDIVFNEAVSSIQYTGSITSVMGQTRLFLRVICNVANTPVDGNFQLLRFNNLQPFNNLILMGNMTLGFNGTIRDRANYVFGLGNNIYVRYDPTTEETQLNYISIFVEGTTNYLPI